MNKLNLKLSSIVSSLCAMVLGFLGFGCSNSDDPDDPDDPREAMYGTPTGYFEIKGEVTDEAGEPIPDVDVRVTYPDVSSDRSYLENDTTGTSGKYTLAGQHYPLTEFKVVCIPPGDTFEADSTYVEMKYVIEEDKKNDTWYMGSAEAEVNFKLKRKSEE